MSTSVVSTSTDSPGASSASEKLTPDDRAALTRELFAELESLGVADEPARQRIRQQIAELNIDLVHGLARRYRGRGESDDDLRQAGYIGLMKAVNRFSTERGTDFFQYAVPTITGEIKRYFRDCCWTIRPTRNVQELQARVSEAGRTLAQDLGRSPRASELAEVLDEDGSAVLEALAAHHYYSPRSLDASLDESGEAAISALVGEPDLGYHRAEVHVMLAAALRDLSDREKEILRLRFFEDLTQREIAARIGVTQMQVSRLLSQCFARIRTILEPSTMPA